MIVKLLSVMVAILALFTVVNVMARKQGKLNGTASKAIDAFAACARFFVCGVMAFLGFAFAMYVAKSFF